MAEHLTDEEQSERIKKWWADNYKSLLMSLVIVAAGYYAYNSYTQNQTQQTERASQLFGQLVEHSQTQQWDKVTAAANEILEDGSVESYSNAARLSLAKVAVVKEDYAKAINELNTLIKEGKEAVLVEVAKIRLARVYLQTQEYDSGLELLANVKEGEFAPQMLELRGDFLQQKGDKEAAITAYEDAASKAKELNIPIQGIERKLDNLKTTE